MFRLSLIAACLAASAEAFTPALPLATFRRTAATSAVSGLSMQRLGSNVQAKPAEARLLTPELFTKLDADRNGTIELQELRIALGDLTDVEALMQRADLNGDGVIDYAEYERLMNMDRYMDGQGGNLYVRNALKLGLLKKGSVLEDCVMVGNKGFDPLSLATSQDKLNEYREAELKHGRLAMLAAAGWPVSELVQPMISKALGFPDLLAAGEKAPSVLNGGLDAINPAFFMGIVILMSTLESVSLNNNDPNRKAGDLGFDPLRLYTGKTEDVKRSLELKELNNGRLAMIAITAFAAQEFVSNTPVAHSLGTSYHPPLYMISSPISLRKMLCHFFNPFVPVCYHTLDKPRISHRVDEVNRRFAISTTKI